MYTYHMGIQTSSAPSAGRWPIRLAERQPTTILVVMSSNNNSNSNN